MFNYIQVPHIIVQALSFASLKNSLEILYPAILVMENNSNKIQLDLIQVDEDRRGEGIGQEIMTRLISYSNMYNLPIELTPSGKFGSNKRKLKKFYKKLGFVKNQRRKSSSYYAMIRYCDKRVY